MNTIFMNSENGKTCYSHKQLLNITDKLHLRRKDKYITSSMIVFTMHGKI